MMNRKNSLFVNEDGISADDIVPGHEDGHLGSNNIEFNFKKKIEALDPDAVRFKSLRTVQLNLGNLCNLFCNHCHVEASPAGKRIMGMEVMRDILEFLGSMQFNSSEGITLDITGGCPEMNPCFRYLIQQTGFLGIRRIVRTNLAILTETGMDWLPEFYREHGLTLTASLPCYTSINVDSQRGKGVFQRSIEALRRLNAVGYGDSHELNLVYNPGGIALPGPSKSLEDAYRKELLDTYGIRFTRLFTMTNAPVGRFRKDLEAKGNLKDYLLRLTGNFNPQTVQEIMCRSQINIDWKGDVHNCDFNLACGMPARSPGGFPLNIKQLTQAELPGMEIRFGEHCFGCTAGDGSSCNGSIIS